MDKKTHESLSKQKVTKADVLLLPYLTLIDILIFNMTICMQNAAEVWGGSLVKDF